MDIRLKIFLLIVTISLMCIIINMIRRGRLELKYSLAWITVLVIVFLVVIKFDVVIFISRIIGIYDPVNTVFYIALIGMILISFSMTIVASRQANKIKILAQKLSLIEFKLNNKLNNEETKI